MKQLIYAITFTETILVVTRLTDEGRDVWLIEITGGPGQDCENCVNYNFTNMTESYVPALLSGVENYTDQHSLQYVGFSNGCRAALSSLDMYDASGKVNAGYYFDQNDGLHKPMNLSANLVSEFIGVGCPGAFEGSSPVALLMDSFGDQGISQLERDGVTHVSFQDAIQSLCRYYREGVIGDVSCTLGSYMRDGSDTISLGLFKSYVDFVKQSTDPQPGANISVDKLTIISGIAGGSSDFVVTSTDSYEIFNVINSGNKQRCIDDSTHAGLPDDNDVKDMIKRRIKGEILPWYYGCVNS